MKICVTHPGLGFGGSEAVVMALLETLQEAHEVVLITSFPFEESRLNGSYHTNVSAALITTELAKMPSWLRKSSSGDLFRRAMVARYARRCAREFDLCISGCDFVPFSRPAVQFVADLMWDKNYRKANIPKSQGLMRAIGGRRGPIRDLYYSLANMLTEFPNSPRVRHDDVIVANSRWTADFLQSYHGIASRVIYPPVHIEPFDSNAPRSGDFVMLGRISPEKRIHEAIEVLARVRARGHDVRLNIVGPLHKSNYIERIKELSRQNGKWVRLLEGVYGQKKFATLASHSFALHMRTGEPFGISVAEYMAMGLIPFVPAYGAPREIVADERLCFHDSAQAVEMIDAVLRDTASLSKIRAHIAVRAGLFSKERFASEIRALFLDPALPVAQRL